MEETLEFKAWILAQIKHSLLPILKEQGYKKSRTNTYARERGDTVQFVTFDIRSGSAKLWWGISPPYFPLAGTSYRSFPLPPRESSLCAHGLRAELTFGDRPKYLLTPETEEAWREVEQIVCHSILPLLDLIPNLDELMAHAAFNIPDNTLWQAMKSYTEGVYACLSGDFTPGTELLRETQRHKEDYLALLKSNKREFGEKGDQLFVIFEYTDLFCAALAGEDCAREAFLAVYQSVCADARKWYKTAPSAAPPANLTKKGASPMEFILNETLFDRLEKLRTIYRDRWGFRFCTRYTQDDPEYIAYLEKKWGKTYKHTKSTNLYTRGEPVPPERMKAFEDKWSVTLPTEARNFLLQHGEVHFDVDFGDRAIVLGPHHSVGAALLDISLDEMARAEALRQQSLLYESGDEYDIPWRESIGLMTVPNGDIIAIHRATGKVLYLSHDGDTDCNGMVLGSSLNEYVHHLLQVGLAGSESWVYEGFMSADNEGLDPLCLAAQLFRQIVGLAEGANEILENNK